jgi:colanic acid biosynthesis glycosyl transferase WcaI
VIDVRILIIHRYFWPDTPPYAHMLRFMAGRLARDGHAVTVLSTQPSYSESVDLPVQARDEELDGFAVRRVRLLAGDRTRPLRRVFNSVLFSLRVAAEIVFKRYDIVMAATAPPVVVAAIASRAARFKGAGFIYHCQDIHPESGRLGGLIRNGALFRFMLWLDRGTCEIAVRIVVLSTDMAGFLKTRGLRDHAKLRVINNFMLGDEALPNPSGSSANATERRRFRIIFAGNMGRFQGLEPVIDAMHRLGPEIDVELVFVGEGVVKPSLMQRAGALNGDRIVFVPYQPQARVDELIAASDLGLIALQKGVYKVAYPSKTAAYLKLGCPLLVCMEPDSELAQFTQREGIGVVVNMPDSPESIAESIRQAYAKRNEFAARRDRIIELGLMTFGREQALEKWSKLMLEFDRQEA